MTTDTRIYRATIGENDRLVRAASPAQVYSFIARELIKVKVATQSDIVECMTDGIKVESTDGAKDDIAN